MEIAVGEKTLSKLLADQSRITIPSFQRNYSWEKENVEQFVDDIFNCADSESAHFWGPVVFLREPEETNHYQLIDGQQRITTAVMMLALLRDIAFRLENRVMPPGLENSPDLLQVFSSTLYITPLMVKPKFEASYLIDKFLEKLKTIYIKINPFKRDMYILNCYTFLYNRGKFNAYANYYYDTELEERENVLVRTDEYKRNKMSIRDIMI